MHSYTKMQSTYYWVEAVPQEVHLLMSGGLVVQY